MEKSPIRIYSLMLGHYLKIAWRSIRKDWFFSAINVIGLPVQPLNPFPIPFSMRISTTYTPPISGPAG
jgi:hypothetical protein